MARRRLDGGLWPARGRAALGYRHAQRLAVAVATGNSMGTSALAFDARGELLLLAQRQGLQIFDFARDLPLIHSRAVDEIVEPVEMKPVLSVQATMRCDVARWNPLNQNEVLVVAPTDPVVAVYDLTRCGRRPTTVLGKHATAGGVNDVTVLPTSGLVATADKTGVVHLWDRRTRARPVRVCRDIRFVDRAMTAVCPGHRPHQLCSASDTGHLCIWDIRYSMTGVRWVKIGGRIESMQQHPHFPARIGYQRDDQAVGLADMEHLSVVGEALGAGSGAEPHTRGDLQPCFSATTGWLCAGGVRTNTIVAAGLGANAQAGAPASERVEIPAGQPVSVVAVHPTLDVIVGGGRTGAGTAVLGY